MSILPPTKTGTNQMNFQDYSDRTQEMSFYPDVGKGTMRELSYLALGLAGETGESVDIIKKAMRSGVTHIDGMQSDAKHELEKELGDVVWYLSRLFRVMGVTLEDVCKTNVQKLEQRYGKNK